MSAEAAPYLRKVRSFVRREGRMTASQSRAWETLWPRYGLEASSAPLDLAAAFGGSAPVTMEIGFGNGDHLLQQAAADSARNWLGVEVHRPGVGRVLAQAAALELRNLRVICHDAVEVLRDGLVPGALAGLVIQFPDPWPKKRHHKRRLIQPAFAALAASRLAPGGTLELATDWAEYAQQMLEVLDAEPALENLSGSGNFRPREARPVTRFEARGQRLGHAVFDLAYRRR